MSGPKPAGKTATRTLLLLLAVPGLFMLTACMSFNPKSMRNMEQALIESNPELEIESSMKFGVGALTLDLVDFAFVHDRSIDISKISRAEIGIYEFATALLSLNDFQLPTQIASDSNCPRREVIIRVREEDELVQVAVCIRDEKVTALAVFILEPREMVVINARGNFEKLISGLIRGNMKKQPRVAEERSGIRLDEGAVVAVK